MYHHFFYPCTIQDPNFDLKGAARAARAHYIPEYVPEIPKNFMKEHKGDLSVVKEGRDYLSACLEYAVALHKLQGKSRDAIALMDEILKLDKNDHVVSFFLFE